MSDDCHDWAQWTCAGCLRPMCRQCDGIPGDGYLCWTCFDAEDVS